MQKTCVVIVENLDDSYITGHDAINLDCTLLIQHNHHQPAHCDLPSPCPVDYVGALRTQDAAGLQNKSDQIPDPRLTSIVLAVMQKIAMSFSAALELNLEQSIT